MGNYNNYLKESLFRLQTVMDDSGCRPILFVGTGLSRRYIQAPDWEKLLDILISNNPNIKFPLGYYTQKTNNDLPQVASELVDEYYNYAWENYQKGLFPEALYAASYSKSVFLKYEITKLFDNLLNTLDIEENEHKEELKLLCRLKPHAIITTNYDCLLENIFDNYSPIIGQQVIKKRESVNIGQILKIHGCTTKPEEIVISHEDYQTFQQKQKYLTAKLLTYFIEHPVIFLGYSLSDSNIKGILRDISEIVTSDTEDIMENIWFIDWKKDLIDSNYRPPSDKSIDLGENKTIRVNYLQLNFFTELFETLYQGSATTVDVLKNLQNNIYNIVKSRTITDLEVDLITLREHSNEAELIKFMGLEALKEKDSESNGQVQSLIGLGHITDPQQVLTRYPLRLSDVSEKLGLGHWSHTDKLIKRVDTETGFCIKDSNNRYHLDVGVKAPQHRYSTEVVKLLERVKEDRDYYVYNEKNQKIEPDRGLLADAT